jgi:hypothetical protein
MVLKGLAGIAGFACGGTLLSKLFLDTLRGYGPSGDGLAVFAFLGFMLLGLGLWLIVQDVKPITKPNPA